MSEVQAPALTLEVGLVGGYEGLLHGEALHGEHGVSNQHRVLVGLSRQGLVQLLKHLVRPCTDQVNSPFISDWRRSNIHTVFQPEQYRSSCSGEQ